MAEKLEVEIDWSLGSDVYFTVRETFGEKTLTLALIGNVVAIAKRIAAADALKKLGANEELVRSLSEDTYEVLERGTKRIRTLRKGMIHSQAVSALLAAQQENEGRIES